jgi:hypothetical protein
MSDPEPGTAVPTRLRTAAFVLAASVIGIPAIVGLLVQAVLYQTNPRGLDLTDPDSYGVETIVALAVPALVILILIARTFSNLAAAEGRSALRYPVLIIQLQLGFAIAAIALVLLTPGL